MTNIYDPMTYQIIEGLMEQQVVGTVELESDDTKFFDKNVVLRPVWKKDSILFFEVVHIKNVTT